MFFMPFRAFLPRPTDTLEDGQGPAAALCALLLGLFVLACGAAAVCAVRVMPFTDGWYETLVFLENHGRKVYADLDFPLPPMTLVFYRLLEALTDGVLAANKLIGVGLSAAVAIFTGLWLRRHVGTVAAIAAATGTLLIETTFPVYIARDYHTLVALFTLASIAAMTATETSAGTRMRLLSAAFAGALCWLLFMTKQNVGLVVGAAFVAAHVLLLGQGLLPGPQSRGGRTARILMLPLFLAGILIGVGLFGFVFQPPSGLMDLVTSLVSTQSKGSPIYVATRIVHDPGNVATIVRAVLMATAAHVGLAIVRHWRAEVGSQLTSLPPLVTAIGRGLVFLAAGVVFLLLVVVRRDLWTSFDFIAIVALAGFLYDAIDWLKSPGLWSPASPERPRRLDTRFLRLALFAGLIFANTLTASINTVGIGLVVAWYGAAGIDGALRWARQRSEVWNGAVVGAIGLASVLLFVRLEAGKLLGPYGWWGVAEPPVIASSVRPRTSDNASGLLDGLRLNAWRVREIERVVADIVAHTRADEPIFTFPSIPLFYRLADRLPATRTYIQWFDFAREESLRADFATLSAAPPRIIVEMTVADVAYEGHAVLLGRPPIQRYFADYLQCLVDSKAASVLSQGLYSLPGITEGQYAARAEPRLTPNAARRLIGSPLLRAEGVRIAGVRVDPAGPVLGLSEFLEIEPDVEAFSDLVLTGPPDAVTRIVARLSEAGPSRLSLLPENAVLRVLRVDDKARSHQEPCRSQLEERLHETGPAQKIPAR